MDRDEILDRIKTEAATIFSMDEKQITEELANNDIDEWDSLGHLRLFMALEETFSTKFNIDEMTSSLSIKDITNLVMNKLQ